MTQRESQKSRSRFLVLLALSHGKMHGYEISKFIDDKTRGFFQLPFGSLYPVLHKLEKEKYIKASWENTDSAKPKKSYQLTRSGKSELKEEISAFKTSTDAIFDLLPARI